MSDGIILMQHIDITTTNEMYDWDFFPGMEQMFHSDSGEQKLPNAQTAFAEKVGF